MQTIKLAILLSSLLFTANALSANDGKITALLFSSAKSAWGPGHSDVVQISIANKFSATNCDEQFAAVHKSDDHLVSAILAAYTADKAISVKLSSADTYFDGSRCIITDLYITP